jgi:branched-chain amino acid transport system permease protein
MIMTFFARITSDLTRSWLLYQGLIFVLVMLFAPQGLGGLVDLHARKVRTNGWKHLVAPYLLCLVVGLLLIAGLVFVVESIHVVLTDAYLAKRTAAKGEWVPYELFGQSFEPFSPVTWAIPIMLLAIGSTLLPMARRVTARAWLAATRDLLDEPIAPSATAAPVAPPP